MPTPEEQSAEQVKEELLRSERRLQAQLDRIYTMVKKGTASSFVEIEYRRAVERLSEKYQLLQQLLVLQEQDVQPEEFSKRQNTLQEQYAEDVVVLAQAIDAAYEEYGHPVTKEKEA